MKWQCKTTLVNKRGKCRTGLYSFCRFLFFRPLGYVLPDSIHGYFTGSAVQSLNSMAAAVLRVIVYGHIWLGICHDAIISIWIGSKGYVSNFELPDIYGYIAKSYIYLVNSWWSLYLNLPLGNTLGLLGDHFATIADHFAITWWQLWEYMQTLKLFGTIYQ